MGSSSPLVCHHCWEKEKKNWCEPCPHALEVFKQGVRKGTEFPPPLPAIELPSVLLEWTSNGRPATRIVVHGAFDGMCGDEAAEPKFEMERRDGCDRTGAGVWIKEKEASGLVKLLGGAILALRSAGIDPVKAIEAATSTDLKTRKKNIECPRCGIPCALAFEMGKSERTGELEADTEIGWTCTNCGIVPKCPTCGGKGVALAKVYDLKVNRICPDCGGYKGADPEEIEEGPE